VCIYQKVGDFSIELCGGTHTHTSLECYPFVIINECGVASGTRRVEALAGESAIQYLRHTHTHVTKEMAHLFNVFVCLCVCVYVYVCVCCVCVCVCVLCMCVTTLLWYMLCILLVLVSVYVCVNNTHII